MPVVNAPVASSPGTVRVWTILSIVIATALFWGASRHASVLIDGVRYHFLDDDQMISMRYARNLALGEGLVWNRNERVEGYTKVILKP